MRLSLIPAALAAGSLLLLPGCAEEPPPEPEPVQQTAPEPEPEPEPEPQPGAGPECPTDHCLSVTVSGDLLFHEGLWNPFAIPTNDAGENFDFMPLLDGLTPYLERSDLNLCNMETPLAPTGGPYVGYPMFSVPPELAVAAKKVGFDVCTTATNHTVDQGTEGIQRTLDKLDEVGIQHTGSYRSEEEAGEVLIAEANGVKVGIVAATFGLNGLYAEHDWQVDMLDDHERAIEKAQQARDAGAEIVIGVQHVGEEYWSEPTVGQEEEAVRLLDSGLYDFVLQHHSHAPQPFQEFGGKYVLHSPGNLISESAPPERHMNNEFVLARVQFAKQEDDSWTTNDIAWTAATNMQNGGYRWCSVASDAPQGVCQSEGFDADVRERNREIVNMYEAPKLREWLITKE